MSTGLFLYVWKGVCNCDWTGGDAVVVARSLEKAKVLALNPLVAGSWDSAIPVREPDYVSEITEHGVCWYGPGGA